MRRLFWLGLGAAAGVMATRRANRAVRHLTPGGFADDVSEALRELAGAIGSFGADVRAGMAERELELQRLVDERTGIPMGARRDRAVADGVASYGAATARARGVAS